MGLLGDLGAGIGELGRVIRTEMREQQTITGEAKERLDAFINQAEGGDIIAMMSLANWYYEGTVLRYDPDQACYWWTRAAEAGDVDAMYNLGLLYNGDLAHTFCPDEEKAVFWLNEAIVRGNVQACQVLEEDYKWSPFFKKWKRK